MNCKQGDLAVVVRSRVDPSFIGVIVRCLRHVVRPGASTGEMCDGWVTEPSVGGFESTADHCLRPIRDNDGEDETLTWVGKPKEAPALRREFSHRQRWPA